MKKYLIFFMAMFLSAFAANAWASDFYGYVAGIFVINGKVFVSVNNGNFNGAISPCSSSSDSGYYIIDINSTFGKLEYSNVLAAKATGHRVYVRGDGSCNGNAYGAVGAEIMLGVDLRAD
ncbi:hypothetical protein [Massilia phyllosphaerae]|uniref:hypothetical protein n=1 Tax=Massilia phyllosphaerae TaxID=3106034 RepID=UPI002B1CC329|nr:hypothetical protein [Massilia sp. SGZ-792]